jgi:hypothetical protein
VLLQFIINNKESIFFVPYKIYSFFALMGNPVRFGLPQLFSENPIREILTDPLQKCNPYPSFIQITLIRDFPESSKSVIPVPLKII